MPEYKRKFSRKYSFKNSWLLILLSFSLLFFLFSLKLDNQIDYIDFSYQPVSVIESIDLAIKEESLSEKITKDLDQKIAKKEIKAQSIVILDTSSDEIVFGYNKDDLMPLASLVKLVSVWLAIQELPSDSLISIDKVSLGQSGDNGLGLFSKYNLLDLIGFSLVTSSNDAVFAMMMAVDKKVSNSNYDPEKENKDFKFSPELFSKLTSLAYKNGLEDFYTNSTTGLDLSDAPTAFASASQMARFVKNFIIANPEISISSTKGKVHLLDEKKHTITQKNTNPMVEDFTFLTFSKTGYTQKSGGNLVWAINKEGKIFVVVLMGSGFDSRFSDFKEINLVLQSYL